MVSFGRVSWDDAGFGTMVDVTSGHGGGNAMRRMQGHDSGISERTTAERGSISVGQTRVRAKPRPDNA